MSKNILIVEDDRLVRENLNELLSAEGYECSVAEDGLQALNSIKKFIPDLIITDIMMPYMDGFELIDRIRKNKKTELTPVIFLSAKTNRSDIREGMNLGADDYIPKPFSADDLLSAIKTRFKKHEAYTNVVDDIKENIIKYVPHELRTPLVAILGYSDLMLDDLDSLTKDDFEKMLGVIKKSGLRLSEWVEKFIFFTEVEVKFDLNKMNVKREDDSCYTPEVIWEDNYFKNRAWIERKNDIKIKLDDATIKLKKAYLEYIILELVENSAKFSEPGTKIKINGVKTDSHYKITFSDSGIGFLDDDIKRIAPLKQFNRDDMQQNGNGLGLAIVNRLVQMCDGKFEIESKRDEYSIITIEIPLVN